MATSPVHAEDIDLESTRAQYFSSLDASGEALAALRKALNEGESALQTVRAHMERHGKASDFFDVMQPAPLRANLSGALTDFERARHRSQRLLFRLLWAEGTSMSDIARAWGISRQLVSRLINEPDRDVARPG
jgi:DNA invertase Pin-like site-specific DNA recombinase